MFTTKTDSSAAASAKIVPVRPASDAVTATADGTRPRRTLGFRYPSRRTFGRGNASRRTFGRGNASRRTFGAYHPSRRTFGIYHP
jgi:hypothetical protein